MDKKIDNSEAESKKTVKTAFYSVFGNVLALVVGAAIIPILARVLSQEDIGISSSFMANRTIVATIVTLSVYTFVNRALVEFSDEKKGYIRSITLFMIAIIIGIFLLLIPFKDEIISSLRINNFMYFWFFISMLVVALYYTALYFVTFHSFVKTVFAITLLVGPVGQLFSVFLAAILPENKYIGRIIGLDIMYVVISLVLLFWVLIILRHEKIKRRHIKSSLKFSVPLIPHLLSQTLLSQCDLIMITIYIGAGQGGIYSMGNTIGFLALTVVTQIMSVWTPWMYRRLEEGNHADIKNNYKIILSIGLLLTCALMTICPEAIKIFLPSSYGSLSYIVPPVTLAMFVQFCYFFYCDAITFSKKTYLLSIATVCAAGFNVLLNLLFIPLYGVLAACYTTLASYILLFVINYFLAKKHDLVYLFDVKVFLVCIGFLSIYMILMMVFTSNLIIRYLAFILVFAYVFGKLRMRYKSILKALISR